MFLTSYSISNAKQVKRWIYSLNIPWNLKKKPRKVTLRKHLVVSQLQSTYAAYRGTLRIDMKKVYPPFITWIALKLWLEMDEEFVP